MTWRTGKGALSLWLACLAACLLARWTLDPGFRVSIWFRVSIAYVAWRIGSVGARPYCKASRHPFLNRGVLEDSKIPFSSFWPTRYLALRPSHVLLPSGSLPTSERESCNRSTDSDNKALAVKHSVSATLAPPFLTHAQKLISKRTAQSDQANGQDAARRIVWRQAAWPAASSNMLGIDSLEYSCSAC